MRAALRHAATLGACVLLAACGDSASSPTVGVAAPVPVAAGGIELTVDVESDSVALGGAIVFRVALRNLGAEPVQLAVPRIDRSVLSFRVRRKDAEPAVIERLHATLDQTTGEFVWQPADAATVAPGDTLERKVSVAAIQTGKQVFVPQYARAGHPVLTGSPVEVDVLPDGDRSQLGAQIETNLGKLLVKLRPDAAYNTVESFASLASRGFFDGLTFHRIVADFMAQGGDPKGDGSGGPGYFLPREMHRKLLHDRGVLSMARTGHPDTSGSQFFLLFARSDALDPKPPPQSPGYITFGEMVEGEETLAALEGVEVEWPPRLMQALRDGKATERDLMALAQRRKIEKSWPKERVEIRSVKLRTLK